MSQLLDVQTAREQILANLQPLTQEFVALPASLGRILAQDIYSEVNLPPFDNSAMDGFAVRAVDTARASTTAPATLRVTMDIPAGHTPTAPLREGEAARIMTGAVIPEGANAIVPVENTDADFSRPDAASPGTTIKIFQAATIGDSIRHAGENLAIGQRALIAGTNIRPQEIGILAGLGIVQVPVIRKPRVVILGSGDELIDIDQPLTPGKIRDTNSYTLEALVKQAGAEPIRLPIAADHPDALRTLFHTALAYQPDMLISSAGVSVGAADFVRAILDEIGEIGFWRLNLRPGKPFAYGHLDGVPFFGLPGNPVSVMITFEVIVRPALNKLAGRQTDTPLTAAFAGERMVSDGRLTYARVRLERDGNRLLAFETGTQSSGALMSMVMADALLIIPENVRLIEAGDPVTVQLLKSADFNQ